MALWRATVLIARHSLHYRIVSSYFLSLNECDVFGTHTMKVTKTECYVEEFNLNLHELQTVYNVLTIERN